jgi:hypothetical protein
LDTSPNLGKLNEVGFIRLVLCHPCHRQFFFLPKHKSGIGVLHNIDVALVFGLHERVQAEMFIQPKSFSKYLLLFK